MEKFKNIKRSMMLYFKPLEADKPAIKAADRGLNPVFFQRYSLNESREDLTPFYDPFLKI